MSDMPSKKLVDLIKKDSKEKYVEAMKRRQNAVDYNTSSWNNNKKKTDQNNSNNTNNPEEKIKRLLKETKKCEQGLERLRAQYDEAGISAKHDTPATKGPILNSIMLVQKVLHQKKQETVDELNRIATLNKNDSAKKLKTLRNKLLFDGSMGSSKDDVITVVVRDERDDIPNGITTGSKETTDEDASNNNASTRNNYVVSGEDIYEIVGAASNDDAVREEISKIIVEASIDEDDNDPILESPKDVVTKRKSWFASIFSF
mmetsp:Transcript_27683/g.42141  ORF Transcript_27683/g.42141 Transcript_27683/m.42141 type:complete len:259 (-) Transcript_27683:39-815(-)